MRTLISHKGEHCVPGLSSVLWQHMEGRECMQTYSKLHTKWRARPAPLLSVHQKRHYGKMIVSGHRYSSRNVWTVLDYTKIKSLPSTLVLLLDEPFDVSWKPKQALKTRLVCKTAFWWFLRETVHGSRSCSVRSQKHFAMPDMILFWMVLFGNKVICLVQRREDL